MLPLKNNGKEGEVGRKRWKQIICLTEVSVDFKSKLNLLMVQKECFSILMNRTKPLLKSSHL